MFDSSHDDTTPLEAQLGVQLTEPGAQTKPGAIVHMTFGKRGGLWWLKVRRHGRTMNEYTFGMLRALLQHTVLLYREEIGEPINTSALDDAPGDGHGTSAGKAKKPRRKTPPTET